MIIEVLALLIASGAVLGASILAAAHLRPRGVLATLLAIGLFAWASVEVIVGTAGVGLRNLSWPTLFTLAFVELAAVWIALRRRPMSPPWRERLHASLASIRDAAAWAPGAIAILLTAGTLLWRIVLAVRLPVVDVAGWQYHLVTVDVWLQANQIVRVSQNIWTDGWPAGGELLTTWLAAFTRTDVFAGFTGLLPIPLGMVAVAGLARHFGAARRPALLAGLLFGMTPALLALAGTSYVDPGTTAAMVATWWLGLRQLRERDRATMLLLGIAAGLAAGTKDTSLFLIAPILGWVLLAEAWDWLRGGYRGAAWRGLGAPEVQRAVLCLLPFVILGLTWYVKNLLLFGNPIYPIAMGPLTGLPPDAFANMPRELKGLSWIQQVARTWTADWHLWQYAYNVRPGGYGRAWLAIVPFAVAGVALLWRARSWKALGLVVAVGLLGYVAQPSAWYVRYTLFLPALALALAAVALTRLRARPASLAGLVLVGLASISLAAANLAPNIDVRLPHGRLARVTAYVSFVLTAPDAHRADVDIARDCRKFDQLPAGAVVAATRAYFAPHAIVGQELQRILAAPIDVPASASDLVAAMQARGAQWLVTSTDNAPDSIDVDGTTAIAQSDPAHFEFGGKMCTRGRLWRFVPG